MRATRGNDYYLTITESRKRFNDDGYDRHKIFLYKEDFNKFIKALGEAVDYVKTELMPDFDFDAYNHDQVPEAEGEARVDESPELEVTRLEEAKVNNISSAPVSPPTNNEEEVDKW